MSGRSIVGSEQGAGQQRLALPPRYIAGHYSCDAVHIDLDRLCVSARARLFRAEAVGIDYVAQRVLCRGRPPISHYLLSINIGSTPQMARVMGHSRARALANGLRVREFETLWDVDVPADVVRLRATKASERDYA